MKEFVFPGSFDPFTKGHEDIASRASKLCDKLHVLILNNANKQAVFSVENRLDMAQMILNKYPNIEVSYYDGLMVDYLKNNNLNVVVRGLRSESDLRYELQMYATNGLMYDEYETIFIPSRGDYSYTSSSTVKEVALYGGDISSMVPIEIVDIVTKRFEK